MNVGKSSKSENAEVLGSGSRLVIIDGANFLYRAFFALPPLRNAQGLPTNAILGVANMLNKVLRNEQPEALVFVFDAPGKTFRHQLYKEYKANREAMPEDLAAQIPAVHELIAAHRIPILEVSDVEADDVIATLVAKAPEGVQRVIVSTDKDLMQLVGEGVELVDTMKNRRVGAAEVEERFGVPPEKMLDFRSLVGDPSDNIPGVKGIGEKGAAKLIQEWGDLETLLENASEVKGKRAREGLLEHADEARLSKTLSTLRNDLSLPIGFDAFHRVDSDSKQLFELYRRFEFTRLLKDLDLEECEGVESSIEEVQIQTQLISDLAALKKLAKKLAKLEKIPLLVIGTESGSMGSDCSGIVFALEKDRAAYVALKHAEEQGTLALGTETGALTIETVVEVLSPVFQTKKVPGWVGRDVKVSRAILGENGFELAPADFDVEIAAYVLDPSGQRTTVALASQHLGRDLRAWSDVAGKGAKARRAVELPADIVAGWAGEEICALQALIPILRNRIDEAGLAELFDDVEMPLSAVLSDVERTGVRVNEDLLGDLSQEFESDMKEIESEIYALAGEEFLISSPKQLQKILFEKLNLPAIKKTKTGFSTDEEVLERLSSQHELPGRILAYRHLAKLKNTYVDALPRLVNSVTGRIHPHLHQTGTATGRLSCSDPNLQNIPIRTEDGQRIRAAFIPAQGMSLVSADYSQIELRVLAHFAEDETLLRSFEKGEDIHRRTAAEVLGIPPEEVTSEQRSHAKAVNFGIVYGSSAFGLANQLGIATDAAKQYIDSYFARYQGVRRFIDSTIEEAKKEGLVETLFGRRRYLPDLQSRNRVLRQAAERMAVNTVIQGSAADLIKKAMVDVDRALRETGSGARMILQVHDELILESPKGEIEAALQLVREQMEGVYSLRVQLAVDVEHGKNWREAH